MEVEGTRHFNKVKMPPEDFVKEIFGENADWAEWQAACRIYREDGGKLSADEFMSAAPKSPVLDKNWLNGK